VFAASEHRTASPDKRIAAARRVHDAGYKIAFHLDPIIIYDGAERDYIELLESLFDHIKPDAIAFISMGGLRMTPKLRALARTRFPFDPMLVGEDVLSPDGRWRAFAPARLRMFSRLRERIAAASPKMPVYLCMESPSAHRRVFGVEPEKPATIGARLASL
jgi:spore photoproduct lyase